MFNMKIQWCKISFWKYVQIDIQKLAKLNFSKHLSNAPNSNITHSTFGEIGGVYLFIFHEVCESRKFFYMARLRHRTSSKQNSTFKYNFYINKRNLYIYQNLSNIHFVCWFFTHL